MLRAGRARHAVGGRRPWRSSSTASPSRRPASTSRPSPTSSTFRGDSHAVAARRCSTTRRSAPALRCGPVSTPNHKLIPDTRWLLDAAAPARSSPAATPTRALADRARRGDLRGQPPVAAALGLHRRRRVRRRTRFNSIPMPGFTRVAARRTTAPMSVAEPAVLTPAARRTPGTRPSRSAAGRGGSGWRSCSPPRSACALWGVKQGLPFAYNVDENAHFVPRAIGLFGHGWNPHYFVNPPAYTYLLHVVFDVWFGGRAGRRRTPSRPTRPRSSSSRASPPRWSARSPCGCCTWPGRSSSTARVGLLAAALLAVAFLAVFYSHLALNDVADAGADRALAVGHGRASLRDGRLRDYAARPGVGLGLACATKYTGGIVAAAAAWRSARPRWRPPARARRRARAGSCSARGRRARRLRRRQPATRCSTSRPSATACSTRPTPPTTRSGKLGLTQSSGHLYYLWTFTWGLGWVPLVAAVVGAAACSPSTTAARCSCSCPAPILYVLFMGTQARFFGRWLLPRLPDRLPARRLRDRPRSTQLAAPARARRWRPALAVLRRRAAARPGRSSTRCTRDVALARRTRATQARAWLVDNVPGGHEDRRRAGRPRRVGQRHRRARTAATRQRRALVEVPRRAARTSPTTARSSRGRGRIVNIEDYERTLYPGADRPATTRRATAGSWSGSTQRGRAEAAARGRPAGDRLLPRRSSAARRSPTTRLALPHGRQAGEVQLRLDLRLLPAGLRAPGPGDARSSALARRQMRARVG